MKKYWGIVLTALLLVGGLFLFLSQPSAPQEPEPSTIGNAIAETAPTARETTPAALAPLATDSESGTARPADERDATSSLHGDTETPSEEPADESVVVVIQGRVTDRQGNALPGARITIEQTRLEQLGRMANFGQVFLPTDERLFETIADDEGRYTITRENLPLGAQPIGLRLGAAAEGFAAHAYPDFMGHLESSGPTTYNFSLPQQHIISGRVVDEDDRPIDVATIKYRVGIHFFYAQTNTPIMLPRAVGTTRSGEDGRFRILGIAQDFGTVDIIADGFETQTLRLKEWGDGEALIVLRRADGVVRGVVTNWDQTEPLPGVTVRLLKSTTGAGIVIDNSPLMTTTDAAGRYEFTSVPRLPLFLIASDSDQRPAINDDGSLGDVIDMVGSGELSVDLRIAPFFTIEGRVTDSVTGSGLSGVSVHLVSGPNSSLTSEAARTTADGSFVLHRVVGGAGSAGNYSIRIDTRKEGYRSTTGPLDEIRLDPANPRMEIAREMAPLHHIRGRVVTPSRLPVGGARVAVIPSADITADLTTGGSTVTDPDGSFEIPVQLGASIALQATAEGFAQSFTKKEEPILITNEPTEDILLVMDPGARLEFLVVDEEGAPIQNVSLNAVVHRWRWMQWGDQRTEVSDWAHQDNLMTDASGGAVVERFPSTDAVATWPFVRTRPDLFVNPPGEFLTQRQSLDEIIAGETKQITITLERSKRDTTIGGIVLNRDREPLPGAGVRYSSNSRIEQTLTGPDGRFLFEELDFSESANLEANHPVAGFRRLTELRPNALDHEIVIGADRLDLTVIVLDAQSKEPLASATVSSERRQGLIERTRVEGSWLIQTRNDAEVAFTVAAPGYESQQLTLQPNPDRYEHIEVIELRRTESTP